MRNKFKIALKALYSNKELMKIGKIKLHQISLLLFITLMLLIFPMIYGKSKIKYEIEFPNLNNAIKEVISTAECSISEYKLSCDIEYEDFKSVSNYNIFFFTDSNIINNEKSAIIFNEKSVYVKYTSNDELKTYQKEMDYSKIIGTFDFSSIHNEELPNDLTREEYINKSANLFTQSLYYSTTADEINIIIMSTFTINLILLLGISILFLTVNLGNRGTRINYKKAFVFVLYNYFSVAFLTSIIALIISPLFAQMAFPFILIIRQTTTYFYLLNPKRNSLNNLNSY